MEIKIDSEFKNLIPPLTADERKGLEESILREGCRDALVTWNGVLIDGHNRYEICKRNGIPYKVKEISLADRNAAKIWIIKNQLGRRNLPPATRILLAKKLEPQIKAQAKERQGTRTDIKPTLAESSRGQARDKIAEIAGVSHGTVSAFDYVQKHGTPQAVTWMKSLKKAKLRYESKKRKRTGRTG